MSANKIKILLPTIHVCSENCKFIYFLGFRSGPNKDYNEETGKCPQSGTPTEHQSPPVSVILKQDLFKVSKTNTYFIKGDEIVITDPKIEIKFSYPLKDAFIFEFTSDQKEGFTRKRLVELIATKYQEMYDEEAKTSSEKVLSEEERLGRGGLVNRNQTNGKYGIWGHDIEDLYLEGIHYNKETKLVTLDIGS